MIRKLLNPLIDMDDRAHKLYEDCAYISQDESIDRCGMRSVINKKGTSKQNMTDVQKASNSHNSKARAKVEHNFVFTTNTMKAMDIQTIGLSQATAKIGLANLTYNMMRCIQLGRIINAAMG